MAFEKLSDRVRQLIGENEQRAAADLLLQAFREKNTQLFNIALMQQADIKKLADQGAAGILSAEEFNRAQAKINAALLHLSDEHARLFETATPVAGLPRWVLSVVAAVALLLLVGWLVKKAGSAPNTAETFDVDVYLHDVEGEQMVIADGQVNLRIGEKMLPEPHQLDVTGKASFQDISGKYRDSTVHLVYYPSRKDRRFKIKEGSNAVLTGQDQSIRFALSFLPDTTMYEGIVRESGHAIAGAKITIDGNLNATSNENGYFKVAIPKASGSVANFLIEKNGKRIFLQTLTISPGPTTIPIAAHE